MASQNTVIAATIAAGGVVIAAGIVGVAIMRSSEPVGTPIATSAAADPVPPTVPTHEKTLEERLDAMGYAQAFATVRGDMTDAVDQDSPGTAVFGIWAADHMQWSDVAVDTDETTNALARKDSDAARGKRLCASGNVGQIVVDKSVLPRHLAAGQFVTGSGGYYHFIAVRSTGALVIDSWARFCGVVTGLFDFANSGGGTTHAVTVVGMFDLPENKAQQAPRAQVTRATPPLRPNAIGSTQSRY